MALGPEPGHSGMGVVPARTSTRFGGGEGVAPIAAGKNSARSCPSQDIPHGHRMPFAATSREDAASIERVSNRPERGSARALSFAAITGSSASGRLSKNIRMKHLG